MIPLAAGSSVVRLRVPAAFPGANLAAWYGNNYPELFPLARWVLKLAARTSATRKRDVRMSDGLIARAGKALTCLLMMTAFGHERTLDFL
ncbi:hypothetical protein [Lysobacter sp. P5_B9]